METESCAWRSYPSPWLARSPHRRCPRAVRPIPDRTQPADSYEFATFAVPAGEWWTIECTGASSGDRVFVWIVARIESASGSGGFSAKGLGRSGSLVGVRVDTVAGTEHVRVLDTNASNGGIGFGLGVGSFSSEPQTVEVGAASWGAAIDSCSATVGPQTLPLSAQPNDAAELAELTDFRGGIALEAEHILAEAAGAATQRLTTAHAGDLFLDFDLGRRIFGAEGGVLRASGPEGQSITGLNRIWLWGEPTNGTWEYEVVGSVEAGLLGDFPLLTTMEFPTA